MHHEKLECYRQLAHVAEEVARRVARWPRGNGYLADQLSRALGSAVLNLAEGSGKRRYRSNRDSLKSRLRLAYVKIGALP